MNTSLPAERIAKLKGFGLSSHADGYLYRPTNVAQMQEVLRIAREAGRKVVLRGAGRSYGDASIADEAVILDITRMNRVLNWDPKTGIIEVEAGATIEDLWRTSLEDGWWPPVVSGTMFPTMAGALGMNIHGKNNPQVGTIGEQVLEIEVLLANGELKQYTPNDKLFYSFISGCGLFGAITRVKLQMKRVHSGDLRVLPICCSNWDEQFECFWEFEGESDYQVSWVDCFARGKKMGRGLYHAAWYTHESAERPSSLRPEHQDLPDTVMGVFPKSSVWRILKLFNNRLGMRTVNAAKDFASRTLGNGKPHSQSLVGFSFLLDYVPGWQNSYLPGGFIQYQSFVPKERAPEVFAYQVELQQEAKLESFLGVLKRHRRDKFMFSHGVDGFSFALDFKLTPKNQDRLFDLAHRMNELVLDAGGRFYLAKDSTLRPEDLERYLGQAALGEIRALKQELDPERLFTSNLASRLGII